MSGWAPQGAKCWQFHAIPCVLWETHRNTGMQLKWFRAQIENVTSHTLVLTSLKRMVLRCFTESVSAMFCQSQELPVPHVTLRDNYRPGPLRCSPAAVAARAIDEVSSSLHSLEQLRSSKLLIPTAAECFVSSCIFYLTSVSLLSVDDIFVWPIVAGYWVLLIYFATSVNPCSLLCGTPARPPCVSGAQMFSVFGGQLHKYE